MSDRLVWELRQGSIESRHPDLGASLALVALPAVQHIVAVTATNKMHERYVLQTTAGFAVLAALLVYAASKRHAWIGVLAETRFLHHAFEICNRGNRGLGVRP